MSFQLQSGDQYTIVRQLNDPNDSNTYYVRAYIRKSIDDTLLATIDLIDRGNQRFTKVWQVSADTSGQGMYIDIETRVFTDSGYTTESDVYGRDNQPFLVMQRYNPVYGGGGGGNIDYKKVRQIIKEELDKLPKVEFPEIPKPKEVNLLPVLDAIKNIPQPEKVELGGIIRLIEKVRMEVEKRPTEFPKQKEVDFAGIYSEINRIEKMLNILWEDSKKISADSKDKVEEVINSLIEKIKDKTFIALNNQESKKDEKSWRKNY